MNSVARINRLSRYFPLVTLSLVSLLILCFILESKIGAVGNPYRLRTQLSICGETARNGHAYRLMTASLFHVNLGHLRANLLGLLFFSSVVEIILGKSRAVIIILLSALGGATASLLFHIVDWMVGASTILFGVFGGLGILLLKHRRDLHSHFATLAISWCVTLIPLCTLGYLSLSRVDQGAHAGGLVAGCLATWIMVRPRPAVESNKSPDVFEKALLVVLLAILGLSIIHEIVPLLSLLA